jgi:hypothetical protein
MSSREKKKSLELTTILRFLESINMIEIQYWKICSQGQSSKETAPKTA